jgi:hypothetical protein
MRLRTKRKSEILARTWRDWPVCWPGDLDVRDEFRNGVFPVDLSKFGVSEFGILIILIFFGVVAKFRNEERSVGIGDTSKLACFEEFIFEESDISNIFQDLVGFRIEYAKLCISVVS